MTISSTSFLQVLRNISKAVSAKKSAIHFDNFLQKIFVEKATHDEALVSFEMLHLFRSKYLPFEERVFGRDHEKEMLLSKLIDYPDEKKIQLSVAAILGGCGSGKTTLARLVYEENKVKEHFDLRVWVKVEGEELKLQQAAHWVLKSTMGMSCSLNDQDELDEMVRESLQSQKCLIVFDGIESMATHSWMHMKLLWFSVVDSGSKVLITTSREDIAYLVDDQPVELRNLSQDAGWSMFRYLAFGSSRGLEDMSNPIAKNFAALCQGIPLSLRLVGCLMRYDERLRSLLSSDCIPLLPSDASVAILLCIWALPLHLRQCFAYCALFPKGNSLKKEKIIDMWIAHGLVKPFLGISSLEDVGNTYFHQLLHRSLFTCITSNQHGDILEFRVPRLIHEIGEDVARVIVHKEKLGLIGSIGEDAAQLSLVSPRAGKYKSEHLRTLIVSHTLDLGGCSTLSCSLREFKGLQSLDLSCSGIRNLSADIRALKELRYLNLSYTLIQRLPDSVTELSRLRTLDLTWCYYLKVLPEGMGKLKHLTCLDLTRCESLSYMPSGIGLLESLSSMPLFVLGNGRNCASLEELGKLKQLTGKLEIRNLENVGYDYLGLAKEAVLGQKYLDHLRLSWTENAGQYCYGAVSLLESYGRLKVLQLTGYKGSRFPVARIHDMSNLVKLSITNSRCKELPSLGQLPCLKELQLKRMPDIRVFHPKSHGSVFVYGDDNINDVFPSLQQLEFYDLPLLSEWSVPVSSVSGGSGRRVFPNLKTLTIEGCPKLASLPPLPTLRNLIVWNNNDQILSSLASFNSLSSLLINDMGLGIPCANISSLNSLKKLILINIENLDTSNLFRQQFAVLEHLSIRHCSSLHTLNLSNLTSLQKLHILDCRNLDQIRLGKLIELVIEDCPTALYFTSTHLHALSKLIIKGCRVFGMAPQQYKLLKGLQYLFISGCPKLLSQLQNEPSLKSHIPCVVLGDPRAN